MHDLLRSKIMVARNWGMKSMSGSHYPSILIMWRRLSLKSLVRFAILFWSLFDYIFLSFEESLDIFTCNIIYFLQAKSASNQSFSQIMMIVISILTERIGLIISFKTYFLQFVKTSEHWKFLKLCDIVVEKNDWLKLTICRCESFKRFDYVLTCVYLFKMT